MKTHLQLLKFKNIMQSWKHLKRGDTHLLSLPMELQLEVTNLCNLSCVMCFRKFAERFEQGTMPSELLEKMTTILPLVTVAHLFGGGEPLTNPSFLSFISMMNKHNIGLEFNSNGTLLNTETSTQMVDCGVKAIVFSIDGATAKTYESIRIGANFERVIGNIRTLNEIKKHKNKKLPHLLFSTVAMKSNIHDLPLLVQLASNLGVEAIHVLKLSAPFSYGKQYELFYKSQVVDEAPSQDIIQSVNEAMHISQNLGIQLECYIDAERSRSYNNFKPPYRVVLHNLLRNFLSDDFMLSNDMCSQPWTSIVADWNGNIRPCCYSSFVLGNLKDDELEKIWNGDRYIRLRRSFIEGQRLPECISCMSARQNKHAFHHITDHFSTSEMLLSNVIV